MSISRFSLRDKVTLRQLKLYFNITDVAEWSRALDISLTGQRSNSNTVWFNFLTYIIFSINLVSQVTLRSCGTDIVWGCHLLRYSYNILCFLWLYNEFFIILYNILKIAELDCCQIIILRILDTCLMYVSRFSLRDKVTLWLLKLHFF